MDDNMELRHMPEIQSIAAYLRSMTFNKKLFGGYDAESVLDHFSAVSLQYEAVLSAFLRRNEEQAGQIAMLESRLFQAEQENAMYADEQQRITQWYEEHIAWLYVQRNGLQQQLDALQAQAKHERQPTIAGMRNFGYAQQMTAWR